MSEKNLNGTLQPVTSERGYSGCPPIPRPPIPPTGLDKNYDFKLVFSPELPPNFSRENLPPGFFDHPSIFDALKQQLGLKLEAQKGPVEYYVIDRVERPVSN
jgi:uncharacterized protein (TIGR03435 family)